MACSAAFGIGGEQTPLVKLSVINFLFIAPDTRHNQRSQPWANSRLPKITHVPSMYLSELDGPHKGCRQAAIDGHLEIGRRCRELGVDTIVVFDTHWLVNSGYHINNAAHFKGIYTSNELPHFIKNMP